MKPTLLIVEDEPAILRGLTDLFVFHGYDVDSEMDGVQGLKRAQQNDYACILLDVMLPSMSGFEICEALRQTSATQPIMMLTAKSTEQDIINGLSLGADDYVAKPFSTSELVLRVNALVRRSGWSQHEEALILSKNVSVCPHTLTGTSYQLPVKYTRREVSLLSYLLRQNKPVSRDELLHQVWGYKTVGDIDTRTVDIHIAKLRKKIEQDPKSPRHLVTHRGEGYQLYTQ
ncbi:DNA-binding response regulator [Pseudoalteromonas rubra]|uniref:DNA-binding response regulator n=1 Tax=Pseudoalteromonas rubra TaxID=43658 RepID=A0A5S3WN89_9GAMM|nr:response regulator transcription factor [Pseudoalteromonas rubra]TMP29411.1 DNA-binding response regulator [Pseudoalteromonas rubra]TMP33987.1 DNA-binding response regulator [Pseudoalteromonas rubra]